MAALVGLVRARALSRTRELRSLEAALSNNFVFFALLLLGLQPRGAWFLPTLVGIVLFLPLCAGSFGQVPRDRLQLLPLALPELLALRLAGLLMAPPLWIAAILAVLGGPGQRVTAATVILAGVVVNLGYAVGRRTLAGHAGLNPFRWLPCPPGALGLLFLKNLRELLHTLDAYLALAMCLLGVLCRVLVPKPSPETGFGCAVLVVLALSTYGQNLFGAEGRAGLERCRLLPIRGWKLLLAKDLAFLAVVAVLTLPLAPIPGLAAGAGALAVGHHASVGRTGSLARWRFSAGSSSGLGVLQVVALFTAATLCQRASAWWLLPFLGALAGSVAWHGRRLES